MLIENPLHLSTLTFPIIECFHIGAFAVAIGTVALADFRILNLGLRNQTPAQIAGNMWPWTLGGLVVAIFSGLLLFSTDPDMYYTNVSFLGKIFFLLIAIVFHYTIHRRAVLSGGASLGSKLAACISLLLWVSIIFGGIFIAAVRPGLSFS